MAAISTTQRRHSIAAPTPLSSPRTPQLRPTRASYQLSKPPGRPTPSEASRRYVLDWVSSTGVETAATPSKTGGEITRPPHPTHPIHLRSGLPESTRHRPPTSTIGEPESAKSPSI